MSSFIKDIETAAPSTAPTAPTGSTTPTQPGQVNDTPQDGTPSCDCGDWIASATLFAILGGGAALLLADWSMAAGLASAGLSAAAGVIFADY